MKPNIRGFSRSEMHPTLLGWKAKVSTADQFVVVKYRLPLRRNWLIRKTKDPSTLAYQSRAGSIHLVKTDLRVFPKLNLPGLKLLLVSVIALAVGAAILVASAASTRGITSNTSSAQPSICTTNDLLSLPMLESTINGLPSNRVLLERKILSQIGGYRASSMSIRCGDQTYDLFVSEVKVGSIWKLNKAARLEN